MDAISPPTQGIRFRPRQHQHMSPLAANMAYASEQLSPIDMPHLIMSENYARAKWQPTDGGKQVIPETRIGHEPDRRPIDFCAIPGLATFHRPAYSLAA